MIKLMLGASPCTKWSVAQKKGREIEPKGEGWELFKNCVIAKEKFKPDYFLYENNWSAAKPIKEQIEKELGCKLMRINSSLVSGQSRDRFYVFNWEVPQPEDRGILLKHILETSQGKPFDYQYEYNEDNVCEPIRVGTKPNKTGEVNGGQANRIYSIEGKSVTLKANAGGSGAKTGLYAEPNGNGYVVKDNLIYLNGSKYPIKLKDGNYNIRKLTPTECEKLQTMPVGYTDCVSATQRYKQLGNGWTAEVIIHILNGAFKDVDRSEKIVVLSLYDGIATGRYCLDRMGFKNVEYHAFEIDKYAIKVAQRNYPDIIEHGDAFQIREWKI